MKLATRLLPPSIHSHEDSQSVTGNKMQLILTPSSIPVFMIPRDSRSSSPAPPLRPGSASSTDSGFVSPEITGCSSTLGLYVSSEWGDADENTNADAMSASALSLPHIQAVTCYGFHTLSERPTTRRRESLFHERSLEQLDLKRLRGMSSMRTSNSMDDTCHWKSTFHRLAARRMSRCRSEERSEASNRRGQSSPMVLPLGVMSPQQRAIAQDQEDPCLTPPVSHKQVFREERFSKNFVPEMHEVGPRSQRNSLTRASLAMVQLCQPRLSLQLGKRPRQNGIYAAELLTPPTQPEVILRIDFLESAGRIRVRLLQALYFDTVLSCSPCIFARLQLLPGPSRRQESRISKGTNCPIFIEDFLFPVDNRVQLLESRLRIRFYHKTSVLRRKERVGEAILNLDDLAHQERLDVRLPIQTNLGQKNVRQTEVSLRFCPAQESIDMSIQSTENTTHAANTKSETIIYIELNQPNRPTVKRSVSLWRRPCDSAQDSGHVILPISPKIDDLEMTSLTLTMSWDCKIGGIGQTKQVRFGCGATEESEIEHWNFTLQHPFVTSSRLHTFM